jgi:hypothetical protein
MRCPLVLLTLPLFVVPVIGAQPIDVAPRNAVYLAILGNAGLFSLNYDRRLAERGLVRAGLAGWTGEDLWGTDAESRIRSALVMVGAMRGKGRNRAEFGIGVLMGRKTEVDAFGAVNRTDGFVTLTGTLGYRRQSEGRGFLFRAGITPFFGFGSEETAYPDKGLFPSVGLSVGYTF